MGSSKGKVAEREVARLLSEWWGQLEPGAQFVRTPCSGGWSSREVRTGFRASGDIMTTAVRFSFTVESKRREGWSPANFDQHFSGQLSVADALRRSLNVPAIQTVVAVRCVNSKRTGSNRGPALRALS